MVLPSTAGTFNSVTGTPGITDALVQQAYDLALRDALKNSPVLRNFVTVRPIDPAMNSNITTLTKMNWFTEAQVNAAKTPLSEEADVSSVKVPAPTQVNIEVKEYGFVTSKTSLLTNVAFAPFDPFVSRALNDHCMKVVDELVQDQIKSDITEQTVGGGAEGDLTTADVFTSDAIRAQYTRFQTNNVPYWDGEFYAAVLHPNQIHDLREETGPGGWRVAKEYINDGEIRRNEVGEYEGFRFLSNNRLRTGLGDAAGAPGSEQAVTRNAYFFGYGGLAEDARVEPHAVISPQVDNLRRFETRGWYSLIGWKVYEPLAIDILLTSSSLN